MTGSGAAPARRPARPSRSPSTTRATSSPRRSSNPPSKGDDMTTVCRVYDSYAQARAAVDAVQGAGVPASDVSIVANKYVSAEHADVHDVPEAAKGAGIGGALGGGAGLLAGLGLLAIPGLGPVVAAGWLASTAVGAAAGAATGGIVGALVDAGVSKDDASRYAEGVRRGGTLVSARVPDQDRTRLDA